MKLSSDVTTLIALFAIVSPITSIPVFLSLTSGISKEKRRVIALQTALVSGLTLFIAYFVGDVILQVLSIQMDAFRVAGALIIGAIGWSMVMGRKSTILEASPMGAAVVPLAIPMMAGPGAIATVIAIGNSDVGIVRIADVIIILVLSILTGILLLAAEPIERILGEQGLMVVTRIFGLLLLAIAASTVMSAIASAFPGLTQ
ncbi:MAG: MarC family protein [Candidatus Nanopelagicaceae bacterium]|nr:MarC family protein [Candidatus Nanopelagicaceae bacterium]